MNFDQMAEEARKRLQEFINRSAGQHLRAMRNLHNSHARAHFDDKKETK